MDDRERESAAGQRVGGAVFAKQERRRPACQGIGVSGDGRRRHWSRWARRTRWRRDHGPPGGSAVRLTAQVSRHGGRPGGSGTCFRSCRPCPTSPWSAPSPAATGSGVAVRDLLVASCGRGAIDARGRAALLLTECDSCVGGALLHVNGHRPGRGQARGHSSEVQHTDWDARPRDVRNLANARPRPRPRRQPCRTRGRAASGPPGGAGTGPSNGPSSGPLSHPRSSTQSLVTCASCDARQSPRGSSLSALVE